MNRKERGRGEEDEEERERKRKKESQAVCLSIIKMRYLINALKRYHSFQPSIALPTHAHVHVMESN